MSVISITFHTVESENHKWDLFVENDLPQLVDNLFEVEKYILSEVDSEMIMEGKNTNLLLVFQDEEKREDFRQIELKNITEIVEKKFGENVMVFTTLLNPLKINL
ncbi:DUF4286 family protein [Chryseobacterium sp. MP_3.2]|uniref:DUF4286 family protein n=1 Tax=Chryseobacterium sp. MP_3.2 TaxID=3071712 RepID=UPI002DF80653|nr:hypothetical protein [Chryseobacterium sp. MP_3.2]